MNGLPYYKAYPRDFIEGTIGMSFELKAAYRLVLDLVYMQGGELPDDARYISGLLGCSVRKWNGFRSKLIALGKLRVSGEFLTNDRAIIELESLRKVQDKQRENRSRPNKVNDLAEPRCDHTEPDTEEKEDTNVSSKKWDYPKPKAANSTAKTNKRKTRLPEDWRLPKEWGEYALSKGMDEETIRREAEQFANHHQAHGNLMLDWRRAWQTWVNNFFKFSKQRTYRREPEARRGYVNAGAFGMIPEVG